MSIDYGVTLAVGLRVEASELERAFGRREPAVAHEEQRFDPRTGHAAGVETVVDKEERAYYVLDGVEHEWVGDLANALAGKLGCVFTSWSNMDGDVAYLFGPMLETND